MNIYFNTDYRHPLNVTPAKHMESMGTKVEFWKGTDDFCKGKHFLDDSFKRVQQNYKAYDIVHTWGIISHYYNSVKFFHDKKIPQVITPIYWSFTNQALHDSNLKTIERGKIVIAELINRFGPLSISTKRKIISMADIVMPNSTMEGEIMHKYLQVPWEKIYPVYYGANLLFYNADPSLFIKKYGFEDFVLFSGEVEPRKNLLMLIKIMKELKKHLVIIGHDKTKEPHQFKDYCMKCRKEEGKYIHFIGKFGYNDPMLASAYAAAHTLAMPSWLETPGISALDAGLAGANLVVTSIGSTPEYFKSYAWYVNPNNKNELKSKLLESINTPKTKRLSRMIKNEFTWERNAADTIKAYEGILEK